MAGGQAHKPVLQHANEDPADYGRLPAAEKKHTSVFIIACPRPQVGKTFVARLLLDFLRLKGTDPVAFDLNPSGDALRDYLPGLAQAADLGEIKSQMAMFDRLIVDDAVAKVVDLGHTSFERFFTIAEEIAFFKEAVRRSIEPVVLFIADPHGVAINAYADLCSRLQPVITIPLFNDGTLKGQKLRKEFPFARARPPSRSTSPPFHPCSRRRWKSHAIPSPMSTSGFPPASRSGLLSSFAPGPGAPFSNSASLNCGCCSRNCAHPCRA